MRAFMAQARWWQGLCGLLGAWPWAPWLLYNELLMYVPRGWPTWPAANVLH